MKILKKRGGGGGGGGGGAVEKRREEETKSMPHAPVVRSVQILKWRSSPTMI